MLYNDLLLGEVTLKICVSLVKKRDSRLDFKQLLVYLYP